jgi:hypothetical protein
LQRGANDPLTRERAARGHPAATRSVSGFGILGVCRAADGSDDRNNCQCEGRSQPSEGRGGFARRVSEQGQIELGPQHIGPRRSRTKASSTTRSSIYISGDNGASPEGTVIGLYNEFAVVDGVRPTVAENMRFYDPNQTRTRAA